MTFSQSFSRLKMCLNVTGKDLTGAFLVDAFKFCLAKVANKFCLAKVANKLQSNLDISNSDISNSAKLEASF